MLICILVGLVFDASKNVAEAGNDKSRFVIGGDGYKLDRQDSIVLIYTHGSKGDYEFDPCIRTTHIHILSQYLGSFRIPRVFERLAGQDDRIAVFFVCHKERSDEKKVALRAENTKRFPCTPARKPLAKFCKRIAKIESEMKNILDANESLDRSQIILAGHSSGGWISMILAGKMKFPPAGVIAFAPATNGLLGMDIAAAQGKEKKKRKKCGVKWKEPRAIPDIKGQNRYLRHVCQSEFIRDETPSALVYAFDEDPYNPPSLLQEIKKSPRIDVISIPRQSCGPRLPRSKHPHSCHQTRTFTKNNIHRISDYIYSRTGNHMKSVN